MKFLADPRGDKGPVDMVLPKVRQYSDLIGTNINPFVGTSASPFAMLVKQAPVSNHDSFLRLRCEVVVSVAVGSSVSDVPPEAWWLQAGVFVTAWWSPTGSLVPGPTAGTSEHFLGSKLLVPSQNESPSLATSYSVVWHMTEPLVVNTSRVDLTASVKPTIVLSLYVFDPSSALDGTYGAISLNYYGRSFVLWGTRS